MRVGILTSGGDCQGLNGAMYGLVKALNFNCKEKLEIYGILEGYTGLINGNYKKWNLRNLKEFLIWVGPYLATQDSHLKE